MAILINWAFKGLVSYIVFHAVCMLGSGCTPLAWIAATYVFFQSEVVFK